MVPLLPLLLIRPARGEDCAPAPSRVVESIPGRSEGTLPPGGRVGLRWENYDPPPELLSAEADGAPIEGRLSEVVAVHSARSWSGLSLFEPREPLSEGAEVVIEFSAPDRGKGHRLRFTVGGSAPTRPVAAPEHLSLSFRELQPKAGETCEQPRRLFTGQIGPAPVPDPQSWLLVYRATPDGRIDEPFAVAGRADEAPLSWTAVSYDLDRDWASECFTVVQLTATGEMVSSADPICAGEGGEASKACQLLPGPAGLLLLSPGLALAFSRSRRR